MGDTVQSGFSRVFLIESQAGPAHTPSYQGLWRAGAVSWDQGDVTRTYKPDPDQYDKFVVDYKTVGEPGSPEVPITARYTMDASKLLKLARNGCDHDLQIHFGKCRDPRDFNGGWEKILILESARITTYGTGELGALDPTQRAPVDEEVPFSGEDLYEVSRLGLAMKGKTDTVREIVDILVCDSATCGLCGLPSDGCSTVLALMNPAYAGRMTVLYSIDGGITWTSSSVATANVNATGDQIFCIGQYTVVLSEYDAAYYYTPTADLLAGTAVWVKMSTGIVALHPPRCGFSAGTIYNWFAGVDGVIYFTDNITTGVTIQDPGTATVEDINCIHGIDELHLVAVGDNNACITTTNGGDTWAPVTGPAAGINLTCVWMKSEYIWLIGTANGKLYYTQDGGKSFVEKAFTGSGAGVVYDIKFTTNSVGYMSHATAAPSGRILRTIDGGYSWYVLPEGVGAIPANLRLNKITTCENPNVVFGGGLQIGQGIVIGGA